MDVCLGCKGIWGGSAHTYRERKQDRTNTIRALQSTTSFTLSVALPFCLSVSDNDIQNQSTGRSQQGQSVYNAKCQKLHALKGWAIPKEYNLYNVGLCVWPIWSPKDMRFSNLGPLGPISCVCLVVRDVSNFCRSKMRTNMKKIYLTLLITFFFWRLQALCSILK